MNTTSNNTSCETGPDTAVDRAERGTSGWEDAVRLQRWATPNHPDFYALAGEMVATLGALDDLAQVLRRQVGDYARGHRLYDDTREVDPEERLADATAQLTELSTYLQTAQLPANSFWSTVGHIGVEFPDPEPPEAGSAETGAVTS